MLEIHKHVSITRRDAIDALPIQYPEPSASLTECTLHALHLLQLHYILQSASGSLSRDRPSYVALMFQVEFADARTERNERRTATSRGDNGFKIHQIGGICEKRLTQEFS